MFNLKADIDSTEQVKAQLPQHNNTIDTIDIILSNVQCNIQVTYMSNMSIFIKKTEYSWKVE